MDSRLHLITRDRSTLLVLGALLLFLYLPFIYLYGFRYTLINHVDFPSFYFGAEAAFTEHRSPYGPDAFRAAEETLDQIVFPYLYPPQSLLFFYPFTLAAGYESAKIAMLWLNHLTFLVLAWLLLARLTRPDLRTTEGVLLFAALAIYLLNFRPVLTNFNHGQINLVVVALVCVAWLALRERWRPAAIGVPMGVAILLKTYPLVFLPMLLLKRQYRALAWVSVVLIVSTIISIWVLPAQAWTEWIARVMPTGGYGQLPYGLFSPATPHNQSINGFTLRLFSANEFTPVVYPSGMLAKVAPYIIVALIAGATMLLNVLARRRHDLLDLEFSVLLLMMFMVGPLSWDHHVVFALPAAMIIVLHLWRQRALFLLGLVALPSAFVLAWDNPYFYSSLSSRPVLYVLAMSMKFYAVLAFWLIGSGLLYWHVRHTAAEFDGRKLRARARLRLLPGRARGDAAGM